MIGGVRTREQPTNLYATEQEADIYGIAFGNASSMGRWKPTGFLLISWILLNSVVCEDLTHKISTAVVLALSWDGGVTGNRFPRSVVIVFSKLGHSCDASCLISSVV